MTCACGCGRAVNARRRYVVGHANRKSGVDYIVDPESGCWVWQRSVDSHGYAHGWVSEERRIRLMHRVYWERANGPIPDALQIDHVECSNRRCVNPGHMRLATNAQNGQHRNGGWGSSRFRGVSRTPSGRWQAYARVGGKHRSLGRFDREEDAAAAASAFRAEYMPFSEDARAA